MKRIALLSLTLLLGTGGQHTAAQTPIRTVNIGLGYNPDVQFTPFYVADKLGYFAAEGLKVNYQHGFVTQLLPLLLQLQVLLQLLLSLLYQLSFLLL